VGFLRRTALLGEGSAHGEFVAETVVAEKRKEALFVGKEDFL
jgi:hypothetical protein